MLITRRGIESLRQPDRNPRCYEMTDREREACIIQWRTDTESKKEEDTLDVYYYGA